MKLPFLLFTLFYVVGWTLELPKERQPVKDWMSAHGYKEEKGSAAKWEVEATALVLVQDGDSTTIATERGMPLKLTAESKLTLELKVDAMPLKGDLSRSKTEDAAFRLFVVFDEGGGLTTPPRTIGYAIASSGAAGDVVTSERFDTVRFQVLAAGKPAVGSWLTFTRRVADDYKRLFKTDTVPPIKGLAIKSDANDTGGVARVSVRAIRID